MTIFNWILVIVSGLFFSHALLCFVVLLKDGKVNEKNHLLAMYVAHAEAEHLPGLVALIIAYSFSLIYREIGLAFLTGAFCLVVLLRIYVRQCRKECVAYVAFRDMESMNVYDFLKARGWKEGEDKLVNIVILKPVSVNQLYLDERLLGTGLTIQVFNDSPIGHPDRSDCLLPGHWSIRTK